MLTPTRSDNRLKVRNRVVGAPLVGKCHDKERAMSRPPMHRILVVDDEDNVRSAIRRTLRKEG